jgi:hypothetical protein
MNHFPKTAFAMSGRPSSPPGPGIDAARRGILLRSLALAAFPTRLFADWKGVSMHSTDNSAALTAELLTKTDRLALAYSVTNLTNSEIFLFNRMYDDVDDDGKYRVGKNLCNIEVSDGHIHISKKIPSVPEFMFVESPNIPCVTAVAARETFSESFDLDLPLKPWTPYATSANSIKKAALPVFFEIGYFVGRLGTRALAKEVATIVGPALRFAPFSLSSQERLRVGPFPPVETIISRR